MNLLLVRLITIVQNVRIALMMIRLKKIYTKTVSRIKFIDADKISQVLLANKLGVTKQHVNAMFKTGIVPKKQLEKIERIDMDEVRK